MENYKVKQNIYFPVACTHPHTYKKHTHTITKKNYVVYISTCIHTHKQTQKKNVEHLETTQILHVVHKNKKKGIGKPKDFHQNIKNYRIFNFLC